MFQGEILSSSCEQLSDFFESAAPLWFRSLAPGLTSGSDVISGQAPQVSMELSDIEW